MSNKPRPTIVGTVEADTLKKAEFMAKHEFPNVKILKVNKDRTIYNVWA